MSNVAYSKSKYRRVPASDVVEEDQGEPYEDEEVYEYEDGNADAGQSSGMGTGLFSTPARTITLVFSVLLLFLVVGYMAWLLGSGTRTTSQPPPPNQNGAVGSLVPVPEINNADAAYSSKPAGLAEAPRVGALPPNFQWVDNRTGRTMTLESLRGKPLLVNFWGTWCPPCRAEMPEMQKIYDRMKGDVTFLGVSMGPRDEPLNVSQFVQLGGYTWDFIHDGDSEVMNRYQVTGIPSTYFIDKTGVIRGIIVGGADATLLEENLKKAQQ